MGWDWDLLLLSSLRRPEPPACEKREREEREREEGEDRLDERKLLSEKMGKRIPVVSPASQQDISNFFYNSELRKEREEQKFEGRAYSHQSRHSSEMSTHFSARNLFPSLSGSSDSHTHPKIPEKQKLPLASCSAGASGIIICCSLFLYLSVCVFRET